MSLFALLDKYGEPIAYHESKHVIIEYHRTLKNNECTLVKVKHPRRVKETERYTDYYLVKCGGNYVPSKFFDDASILSGEALYEYQGVIDIISRELEFNNELQPSDRKSLEHVLGFFDNRIKEIHDMPVDMESVKRFHNMREEYDSKVGFYN